MTNKADCEVVEDLLPSYIDRLTQEKTTQLVQEHLENCISCQKKYETMSLSDEHSSIKEIDYLKKSRIKEVLLKDLYRFSLLFH